ncbi:hypothetical protein [Allosphingosinicella vermicomposti]|uniref:hypothetical protein n=1 Tax=Allosphingosinicella vermicomposti TaxID=614671 RepID=UPI001FE18A41|nr:hypothetical protein [Allosphingosinicella vermicomposti]
MTLSFGTMAGESLHAQPVPIAAPSLTYADAADLTLQAPVIAHVRVAKASRLKGADAAGVPAGSTRFYVEADVLSLIRGANGIQTRVRYLADLRNDTGGRAPKLRKKDEYLIFATAEGGRPGEVRLVAPDAQVRHSAAEADRVRAILREANARDAAPRITGIGRAFHVPGSLPGESETQFFLMGADNRPLSISVLRRPGEQPRWAVSVTEIVDESATAPRPDTLLWYRLACSLPASLPQQSFAEADAATIPAIRADYNLIKMSLGPCTRTRTRTAR